MNNFISKKQEKNNYNYLIYDNTSIPLIIVYFYAGKLFKTGLACPALAFNDVCNIVILHIIYQYNKQQ